MRSVITDQGEEGREVGVEGVTCLAESRHNELQRSGLKLLVIMVCFASVLSHKNH